MSRTGTRPRVVVIGAGLAGTATAIRLLRFARTPLEVVLLERRPDYRSAGVAYHRDGNPWDHVFNIQAGRMSAFREDVLDFVRWANREADRTGWPAPWADTEFVEQGPAPRRIFQDYLADRLAEAAREALPGVVLVEADGEALDVEIVRHGAEVTIRWEAPTRDGGPDRGPDARPEPEPTVLPADHVVLATGLELRDVPFAAEVRDHPAFVRNPYSADGVRRMTELPPQAAVAIVGTVLSAYDSAGLLLRRGHTGPIHLISRSGTVFRTYPGDHEHGVVDLPCPKSLLEPYRDRTEFLARVRREWEAACTAVRRDHPGIDPTVVAERVAKAWEPHLPEAFEQIPTAELRCLLDEFGTAIAAIRVGAVEYTMSVIERAMRPDVGAVRLVTGAVERISPAGAGRLTVSVAGPDARREIEADLVVSNFGRESDYSRVGQPLWRNLLRKGLAVPHRRTGRGLEVDARGALLDPDGRTAGPLSAVGPLREGDELVRNGRTGAFTFNLAAIKNQSIAVAAAVLEHLDPPHDGPAGGPAGSTAGGPAASTAGGAPGGTAGGTPGTAAGGTSGSAFGSVAEFHGHVSNIEEAAPAGFAEAVKLEVRRMATRGRGERESLDSRLDACISSIGALPTLPADATRRTRLIRQVVNRVAVERLTDVSVTPRQLRRQLGIGNADELGD